jgi:hypothetical protein
MEKEVVTYEQAVILNKLHYDGDYNYTYDIKKELWYGDVKADGEKYLAAPLKQQVFRWFRKKYNRSSILFHDDGDIQYGNLRFNYEIRYITYSFKNLHKEPKSEVGNYRYKTYEEAENTCIDKLIEIAKQQDND